MMRKQKGVSQMKGQDKIPEKQLNKAEIGNLLEKEFRIMIVRMIQGLGKRMEAKTEKMMATEPFFICCCCWVTSVVSDSVNPTDGSLQGSPLPRILQARTLDWVAISFSNAWKWKVKVKSLSHVRLLATPWTAAYQAPPSMGFSRQEYWSGVPFPPKAFKYLSSSRYRRQYANSHAQ